MPELEEPEWGVNFETGDITRPDPPPAVDQSLTPPDPDDEPFAPAPPPAPGAPESVPKYRFDDINTRLQQATEREQRLIALLEQRSNSHTPPQTAPGPPSPTEAAKARVRQQLLDVMPEIADLLKLREHVTPLLTAADAVPQMLQDTQRYWASVAEQQVTDMEAELGKRIGHPITPKTPLGRMANRAFADFVAADPKIQVRYERQDPRVIQEFVTAFEADILGPMRRQQQTTQRLETTRRLPVAGRTSPPPAAAPPKPDMDNDDEVWQAAWNVVANARQAQQP